MPRFLAALLALASFAAAAPVPKIKRADLFPHAVGTKWEYIRNGDEKRVYVEEVTESEEKDGVRTIRVDVTTDTGGKLFETYKIEKGELLLTASTNATYDPPMLIRKADMKEGDTWKNKYGIRGNEYEVECTVGAAEEITTPAGKYTAFPITRKYISPNVRGGGESTYWYGDNIGLVRQTAGGNPGQELKAYTPGKK